MNCYGDYIRALFEEAEKEVIIIAPFIRSSALAKLLDSVRRSVEILIVTRWRPSDILAGASDLEVFDLCDAKSIPLFLRYDLHAKLFIADDRCLIGSANVTNTALGWHTPANLELLTLVDRLSSEIQTFFDDLMSGSIEATRDHQLQLQELVEKLRSQTPSILPQDMDDGVPLAFISKNWIPYIMNPDELYAVYLKGDDADVSRTMLPSMLEELSRFRVPPGMDESTFQSWIGSLILQTPLIIRVLDHINLHGNIGEAALNTILKELDIHVGSRSTQNILRCLQRWLSYFLYNGFETTPESIKLIRSRKIIRSHDI